MSKFLTILLLFPSLCFAQLSTHNEYHTALEGGFNEALQQAGSTYECNASRSGAYVVQDDASVTFPDQITITCQDSAPTPDPDPDPDPIPDPPPTASDYDVLFVGNSLTENHGIAPQNGFIYYHLNNLIEGQQSTLSITTAILGGATTEQHYNTQPTLDEIANGHEYTVIQPNTFEPTSSPSSFHLNAGLLIQAARDAGSIPVIYQVWPERDQPQTITAISAEYDQLEIDNSVDIVRVGEVYSCINTTFGEASYLALYLDSVHSTIASSWLAGLAFNVYFTGQPAADTLYRPSQVDAIQGAEIIQCVDAVIGSSAPPPPPPPATTTLIEGQDNSTPESGVVFVKGQDYTDPNYGAVLTRVTDATQEPPSGFARNDYSRRQAFNSDNSRFIAYSSNGFWHLYDAVTYDYLGVMFGPGGDAEVQWHPTNPNLFYFLPNSGGLVISQYDITSNQVSTVADFTGRLPWPGAARVWTKSEGSPSADSRYWGFMVETADFSPLGLITYDLETDTIIGTLDLDGIGRPDHVSMTPSGDYIVPSWDGGLGTVAYTRDFSSSVQLHHKSEHSDIALLPNGNDAYIAVDYQSSGGDVFYIEIQTGIKTVLFSSYINGTVSAFHFSGKAYGRPGYVLISTYGPNSTEWLHQKLFLVELENGRILNVAHDHYGPGAPSFGNYYKEPHASISRDGTQILFSHDDGQTVSAIKIDLTGLY
jgi:hypothetical protein